MAIQIVPHESRFSDAVEAFNQRMRAGGSPWGFYVDPAPHWIPKHPGATVWREYHVAVDDDGSVRGAFALKPQDWWVRGEIRVITDWQGPFSEGSVDPRFNTLGLRMMRDMLKKRPELYSWGHGGNEQPVVQMLQKMGWAMHETHFALQIVDAGRFLRLNRLLRGSAARRAALDLLALTGLGAAAIHGVQAWRRLRAGRPSRAAAHEVPAFGPWADDLWRACRDDYAAIAVRDAASMNALLPIGGWPPVMRLKVEEAGRILGWAVVMDTRMQGDPRFGDLRVGSIVDTLAKPCDAGAVAASAMRFLRDRGVDVIVSNQAHPEWIRALADNGCLVFENRRLFAASPALRALFEPFDVTVRGLHMTNLDGHGPMSL
ncbi:MAG TPA: hypothetical protein VLI72_04490 [Methylibium sp.]|nr:hypothetical protein [Methylibium sp.]